MKEIESLLETSDIMRIFGLSRVSIYRKVAEARSGQGRFPLPVSGMKERLRWNAANVEAFCQSRNESQPVVSVVLSKHEKQSRERLEKVNAGLANHGIVVHQAQRGA
jgi:predicted DNA-binding transcriptional regulator AlpA